MHRNLDRRIEVLVRLESAEHISRIQSLLDLHMSAKASTWILASDGHWDRQVVAQGKPVDVHDTLMHDTMERNKLGRARP
jgi:polyphosphate kinase